jgi:hypothetical protein
MENPKRGRDRASADANKDTYLHPSISALMDEARGDETPEDVIRRKCRELVHIAKSHGWSGPAFDPKILASIFHIRVIVADHDMPGEGWITSFKGQVVITVRPDKSEERQRFTICHEIAHTCFPDVFEMVRSRKSSPEAEGDRKFEALCDVGASELLMPHDNFLADMGDARLSLTGTSALGVRYGTSIDAAIRRAVGFTEQPCAALFLTDESFGEHTVPSGHHHVRYFIRSKKFLGFPKPGTATPFGSCVHTCPLGPPAPPVLETWTIDEKQHQYHIESLRLPEFGKDYPKVLALVHQIAG